MSRVPTLTTLRVEDFDSEQRKWLPRLFLPLNQFLTAVTNVLNGRVEFGDNIPCQDQALSFTHDGSAQRIAWRLPNAAPRVLWAGQATEAGLSIAVFPSWIYDPSTQTISITFIKMPSSSLSVGTAYKIFIRAVP